MQLIQELVVNWRKISITLIDPDQTDTIPARGINDEHG
jgi:hypothetical protein